MFFFIASILNTEEGQWSLSKRLYSSLLRYLLSKNKMKELLLGMSEKSETMKKYKEHSREEGRSTVREKFEKRKKTKTFLSATSLLC